MLYNDEKITKIKKLMSDRGYLEWSDTREDGDVVQIEFKSIPDKTPYEHILTCIVNPHESDIHEFVFVDCLNPGALLLSSNRCGPLNNDVHFSNQEFFMINALRRFYASAST